MKPGAYSWLWGPLFFFLASPTRCGRPYPQRCCCRGLLLRLLLAAATAGSAGFEAKRTLLIVHDEWDLRVTPKQKFGGQSLRVVHGTESPGPSPHASPNAYNNILYEKSAKNYNTKLVLLEY